MERLELHWSDKLIQEGIFVESTFAKNPDKERESCWKNNRNCLWNKKMQLSGNWGNLGEGGSKWRCLQVLLYQAEPGVQVWFQVKWKAIVGLHAEVDA